MQPGTDRDHRTSRDAPATGDDRGMHQGGVPSVLVASAALAVALLGAVILSGSGSTSTPVRTALAPATTCSETFPATNVWNKRVDTLPIAGNSATLMSTMGLTRTLHADFGTFAGYGIPFNVVSSATARSSVTFTWPSESDQVGYPIPAKPLIEGAGAGGDRHLLMIDRSACRLWELYAADHSTGRWRAGSGATWSLLSNALRTDGWTSADAAGLPIYPGLVRYDEVLTGAIRHAIRFTVPTTRSAHIYPARHDAGAGTSTSLPPMGLRLRLKASVNVGSYPAPERVILTALKEYGMILADNGSAYYISGTSDPRWSDDDLHLLGHITGSMFEVVDTSTLRNG
jgi:hypothetical protein